jgi:hypothetical protein
MRTIASIVTAGFVAGFLVAGLGGRLMMRLMAATSGASAQGRLTEAEERVGEITLGGSVAFVIFVGLLFPAIAAFVYLPLRRFLPRRAWSAGAVFGLLLLATLGVGDPLSPDNVDFAILTPRPLAVAFIAVLAVLFGMTFAALAAQFESTTRILGSTDTTKPRGTLFPYAPAVLLVPLPPLLVGAAAYVVGCSVSRGRATRLFDHQRIRQVTLVLGLIAAAIASWRVGVTAVDII